jgi:hypothetical protein
LIFSVSFLVTNNAKPLIQHQDKDKENVSGNNNNRAILAISMVKKPPVGSSKPSMLKNTLKKSMSVPSAPASSAVSVHKPLQPAPKSSAAPAPKPLAGPAPKPAVSQAAISSIGQRQFEYAEQAKKRMEQLVQKVNAEKEKELKVTFTANPAPKFKKHPVVIKQVSVGHKKIVKHNSLPQLLTMSKKYTSKENIVPNCGDPERLKLMEEKKMKTLAKYHEPIVQFKAKPAAVLKKQPFQPVHNQQKIIQAQPFKLQLTDRLLMRSEFDRKLHETIAIRKKQEEIRQRQRDFEERRILRQKTMFHAQPNPNRNNVVRNNH